jgi:hypothetical protein
MSVPCDIERWRERRGGCVIEEEKGFACLGLGVNNEDKAPTLHPSIQAPADAPSFMFTCINESIQRLKQLNRRVVSGAFSNSYQRLQVFFFL